MTLQEKFQLTRDELSAALIERDDEITLVLTALLSNEHCLFVGPPGTAKSMLADAIVDWINGKKFSRLMTKTTDPSEILGAVSFGGLKSDDHRRVTHGKLPEADVAFLDELFKSSSACLNTVLGILNERKFENGLTEMVCPLRLCIAASNEWPVEAKELGALFDRFMFRKYVYPIGGETEISHLMFADDLTPQLSTTLTMSELSTAQVEIRGVKWSPEAQEAAHEIRRKLTREGIIIGDRRLRKTTTAVKSYAWLNGNPWVTTDDLEVLAHIWWTSPESQPQVVADAVTEIAQPVGLIVTQYLADARQIVTECDTSDLSAATAAATKLGDLCRSVAKMNGSRAEAVHDRIDGMRKELRLATIDSL